VVVGALVIESTEGTEADGFDDDDEHEKSRSAAA